MHTNEYSVYFAQCTHCIHCVYCVYPVYTAQKYTFVYTLGAVCIQTYTVYTLRNVHTVFGHCAMYTMYTYKHIHCQCIQCIRIQCIQCIHLQTYTVQQLPTPYTLQHFQHPTYTLTNVYSVYIVYTYKRTQCIHTTRCRHKRIHRIHCTVPVYSVYTAQCTHCIRALCNVSYVYVCMYAVPTTRCSCMYTLPTMAVYTYKSIHCTHC